MIQITLIVKSFVSYLYSTLSYFIGEETILLYGVVTKTWYFLFSSPCLFRSTQLTLIKIIAKKGSGFKRFHVPQISKRKQIKIVTVHVGWLLNTHRWDINRMHFSWFFRWLSILSHHHFIFQLFFWIQYFSWFNFFLALNGSSFEYFYDLKRVMITAYSS